jgi:hypothetical protein
MKVQTREIGRVFHEYLCQTNVPLKADNECVGTMMSVNHKWLNLNEGDSLNAPLTLDEV